MIHITVSSVFFASSRSRQRLGDMRGSLAVVNLFSKTMFERALSFMSEKLVYPGEESARSAFERSEIYALAKMGKLDSTLPKNLLEPELQDAALF